jgi:hypothetical protein
VGGFCAIGLKVVIVLAFRGFGHSAASLEASGIERPLSAGAAMMCIVTSSLLGWAAILLPLWVIAQ